MEIVGYLDAKSVFACRQSCRLLARSIELNQRFWFRHFLNGDLLGFFFVFEAVSTVLEILNRAVKQHKMPPQWDWMHLIQQLGHFSSFTNDGVFHDAPPGFRNRRRIWKILEMIEQYEGKGVGKCRTNNNTMSTD